MRKLACGVGICDSGKYKVESNDKPTKHYSLWYDMLRRCYLKSALKRRPTYEVCTVSENFKRFQFFAEWAENQIGFKEKDYHLDKDILVKNNKIYCENSCIFLPRELNVFLTNRRSERGNLPIGVILCKSTGKFHAQCQNGTGVKKYLGSHNNELSAFMAYKEYKEDKAKEFINKYAPLVAEGKLDARVLVALDSFKVNIED